MRFHPTSREDDERILDVLYLKDAGFSAPQIAVRLDYREASYVRTIIQRVRRDYGRSEA
jgi:hypothetical protein